MTNLPRHRGVVTGVASGLILMGVFSILWSLNTLSGWGLGGILIVVLASILALSFFIAAGRLLARRSQYPNEIPEGGGWKKRNSAWFGAVFGVEGILIVVAANVLSNIGHPELIVPAIVLIVGLHFYPMAWIFQRKLDTYVATWTTLVGLVAGALALTHALPKDTVNALAGTGALLATLTYGIYMIRASRYLLNEKAVGEVE